MGGFLRERGTDPSDVGDLRVRAPASVREGDAWEQT